MKSYVARFDSYQKQKRREDIIKESVLQVNDIYKVRTMVDIPQSLINAYVKKVKDVKMPENCNKLEPTSVYSKLFENKMDKESLKNIESDLHPLLFAYLNCLSILLASA